VKSSHSRTSLSCSSSLGISSLAYFAPQVKLPNYFRLLLGL